MTSRKELIEFIALMAMMMSLTALSIDIMLPALTEIGEELGVTNPNNNQLIISTLFLGLAIGQLFYGPLSDHAGRKPTIYFGFFLFLMGTIISLLSQSLLWMLIGRVVQGIGLSGPRIVSMAIIRDKYKGDAMAQIMSFIMVVFIIVPMLAPALGQFILNYYQWKIIFVVILILGLITLVWFAARQVETLPKEKRIPFSTHNLINGTKEVLRNKSALGYTLASGFIAGAFIGFLNSSQQLFQIHYGLGERFPLYFAAVALSIGTASVVNSQIVKRIGMRRMVNYAIITLCITSSIFLAWVLLVNNDPSLGVFMTYLIITMFCTGIQFGNYNSLAMEPLGHIAGIGAAVVGSLSTFISVPVGVVIGNMYNESIIPLVSGFVVFGFLTWLVSSWASRA